MDVNGDMESVLFVVVGNAHVRLSSWGFLSPGEL